LKQHTDITVFQMRLVRSLRWYLKRLSIMRASEIAHRIAEQYILQVIGLRYKMGLPLCDHSACNPADLGFCSASAPQLPEPPWDFKPNRDTIDAILSGHAGALGFEWTWHDDPAVWHKAPDTKKQWPQVFFGSIPYRQGNPYGDVRVAWEPSRLQHLLVFALLARQKPAVEGRLAVALLQAQLTSWTRANPPLTGIHYISAMECGLRILAVCHALDLVRTQLSEPLQTWRELAEMVNSHAHFIEKRLSLHSSAGNHTIAECAGLVYAGVLFPELPRAKHWTSLGLRVLEQEGRRQILPDGGGVEQSLWYHMFVVDLYGLVCALLQNRNMPVAVDMQNAFERGRTFLGNFGNDPATLPAIGDADNGYALSPYLRLSWGNDSLTPTNIFPESGYSIIRGAPSVNAALIFDHGPLGMAPCYGHGHADALSVILRLGMDSVLLGPGTYTYTGDPRWRHYFRGTQAHNTVTIDGHDQAQQSGTFMWSEPYRCELVHCNTDTQGNVILLARHDGYFNQSSVTHWRGVVYRPPNLWLIWDYLQGTGVHTAELHWHIGVPARRVGKQYTLETQTATAYISVSGGETILYGGDDGSFCGWKSPLYGVLVPGYTLKTRFEGDLPHEFTTRVTLGPESTQSLKDFDMEDLRRWVL